MTDDFETRLATFRQWIKESGDIVFFGGAGVSTESGIPDFRGKHGLNKKRDPQFGKFEPEYLLSHRCLVKDTEVFYAFYRQKMNLFGAKPNITHKVLAKLEKSGKDVTVVTQNIDGLHQKAGSSNVLELHGSVHRNYCSKCGEVYPADAIFKASDKVPRCTECRSGLIRPDVVLYGESMPGDFRYAEKIIHKCDMMIVAGTSLTVNPATSLVKKFRGRWLVVINRDQTAADETADLVFRENLGSIFSQL